MVLQRVERKNPLLTFISIFTASRTGNKLRRGQRMTADKPRKQWSELNDMTVIEAMLKDTNSEYWEECSKFVRYYIEKSFSNLPEHLRDDTVQETMLSVHRSLSTFR